MARNKNIMVCITQQKTCERLIKRGAALRSIEKGELFVIHVAKTDLHFLDNSKEGEALEYLFSISKSVGANLTVLKSNDIAKTLMDFAGENHISVIILGESQGRQEENTIVDKLKKGLINIEFITVPASESK